MNTDQSVGAENFSSHPGFALGTPTSIGSLPHRDRDAAVAFVLDRCPELPAAPSLPNVDPREAMIPMGLWGVPGVTVAADGTITVDPRRLDPAAPLADAGLLDPPFASLHHFLAAIAGRRAPVKFQLTGPITLGLALIDRGVEAQLAFATAGMAVNQRAHHLLNLVRTALPDAPLVVFLDEPGLVGGLGDRIPLGPDQAIDLVSSALAVIEARATSGLHCCGPADWRAVLQAGPQILSLPVDAGIVESAGALGSFIERGGWVAWGAVPTDGPLGESAVRLWRVLSSQWCELVRSGCDPVLLRRQALVTPECGLALHSEAQATLVFDLTRRLGERLHDQVANVKLSVGA